MTPVQYDSLGRMKYHPEYHPNHKRAWNTTEQKYLIDNYIKIGPERVAFAIGRTVAGVMARAYELRKSGVMEKPKTPPKKHKRARKL